MTTSATIPEAPYKERESSTGSTLVTLPDGHEVEINRYQVSRSTGLSTAHVSKIFNGARVPSLPVALRISRYLGISVEDFHWIMINRAKYLAERQ